MASERQRLIELALESLWNRKKEIDQEIADLIRELGGRPAQMAISIPPIAATGAAKPKKRSRFTNEERLRRSQRMKAYWDNWRKQKRGKK
jgi:hypothetical protein